MVYSRSIPLGIQDVSALIEEAKSKNVQALLCCAYPDENFKVFQQCMESDYNPDVILFGPGVCLEVFHDIFGEATEGVMGWGAWNEKSSPAMADLAKRLKEHQGRRNIDWWAVPSTMPDWKCLSKPVKKAGTLDHAVLKDIIATEKFDTVIEVWLKRRSASRMCRTGRIVAKRSLEVVAPSEKATAKPLIPKPNGNNRELYLHTGGRLPCTAGEVTRDAGAIQQAACCF